MDITYLGHSSFKLRGKNATLITDPYDPEAVGLKFPKNSEADIVTVSHDHKDHNAVSVVSGSPFVASVPGEYEIKGVSIIGVATFHDAQNGKERGKNTAFRIEMDGVRFAHLGDLGHMLTSQQMDVLDGVDVLFIPVGGLYTIDAKTAAMVTSDIEPRIVIPMHYASAGIAKPFADSLQPVSEFMKAMNKEVGLPVSKLTVSKDKLPAELHVVTME